jgi:hypothetical protein
MKQRERTAEWLPVRRPPASVVVCAHTPTRLPYLIHCLESLRRQIVDGDEIIVVVDHNDELRETITRAVPFVRVVENTGPPGASSARNTGVAHSSSLYILFVDDDATPQPGWIDGHVSCLAAHPDAIGVGGLAVPQWASRRPPWFPDEFGWVVGCSYRGQPTVLKPVRNVHSCNMAVRKSLFDGAGGFDVWRGNASHGHRVWASPVGRALRAVTTRISGNEETEFCIRSAALYPNMVWLFAPEVRVDHHVSAERCRFRWFAARCIDEGIAKATVVTASAGTAVGLADERAHLVRTIPRGILQDLRRVISGDADAARRCAAMVAGTSLTLAGYAAARAVVHLANVRRLRDLERVDHPGRSDPAAADVPAHPTR